MKLTTYIFYSVLLAGVMTSVSFVERPNFYSAAVAISKSGLTMISLANILLITSFLFGKLLVWVFFGELRLLEMEHLYERTWFTVTESFLALAVFKDDFTFNMGIFFIVLMFLRVFHWISSDRVDLMFQSPSPPSTFSRLRMVAALYVLAMLDYKLISFSGQSAFQEGPGVMIMFAFQFCLLLISVVHCTGKFFINMKESHYLSSHEDEDTWEPKGTSIFVLSVFTDFLKLVLLLLMTVFMIKPFGLPLHILVDAYMTIRDLVTRIRTYVKFLRARSQIERSMANATAEDISRDSVCIICREDMVADNDQPLRHIPKKLFCGHVIHHGCLTGWLQRSQRCPTCRKSVLESDVSDTRPPASAQAPDSGARPTPTTNVSVARTSEPPVTEPINGHNAYFASSNANTSASTIPETVDQNPNQIIVESSNFVLPAGWKVLRAVDDGEKLRVTVNSRKTIMITKS